MDQPRREDIENLATVRVGPCVSIYMPLRREPEQQDKNRIRLKNLTSAAQQQLVETYEMRETEAQELLKPATQLIEYGRYWAESGDGLALFLSPNQHTIYTLPLPFTEEMSIGSRFRLTSLFPLFVSNGRFYILALSQNQVRLLQGSQHTIHELPLGDETPTSMAEALQWDDPEKQLQYRTTPNVGDSGRAIFHGHGTTGEEREKEDIRRYLNLVDAGIRQQLQDENAPLLISSVEYLFPIYRAVTKYPHLVDAVIPGNPESLSAEELHQYAWELLAPLFTKERQVARQQFADSLSTEMASADLRQVALAAHYGQVDTIFVPRDQKQWGNIDPDSATVTLHDAPQSDSIDLLDATAVQTFLHGGTVYVVDADDMPGEETIAAVFRSPVVV